MNNTHEKIIEAAKELFSTRGYAATTTKDIANRAEISEVTLFRHFESKRNLFHSALHSTFEADVLINFFEKELKYDLDEDLLRFADYLYQLYEKNGQLIKMLMKDKENNNLGKISKQKDEKRLRKLSEEYFQKMHDMGKITDDPIMCSKFFFSNAVGFLMRKFAFSKIDDGIEYYDWMIKKTITAIKMDNTK